MTTISKTSAFSSPNTLILKDEKDFSLLYDTYAGILTGAIRKMIHCPLTAEDILQNSFIKIWSNSESYNSEKGSIFTWMLRITRNETIDYLRSKTRRNSRLTTTIEDSDIPTPRELPAMTRADITTSLNRLPKQDQSILHHYCNGYTCREIATIMEIPEGTIKTKMRRSYSRLRLLMAS